ncbi:MAG: hypothetical protein IIV43_00865 [Oscillospiraceae bacterium]|nr:hypothetical protein [Oscillospiraceae bacterium]
MKKGILFVLIAALAVSLTGCSSKEERSQYKDAVKLYEDGKYSTALPMFESLDGYKDSEDYLSDCRYSAAMQTVSPDSTLERGYSGNIVECNESNASQYSRAVELLELLDGYQDSERMLRAADKELDRYNEESQTQRLLASIESKFLGYLDRCEYDGSNFYVYFSASYPITYEVLQRGQTETGVAESWHTVRGMFTEIIFEYLPDCIIHIVDSNGKTLGSYLRGSDNTELNILFDIAEKPY